MKRVLLICLFAGLAYVAYDEYQRHHSAEAPAAADPGGEVPHWEDVEQKLARGPAATASLAEPRADSASPAQASPAARDGWSEGGGLVGRFLGFVGGITDAIRYVLFGAPKAATGFPADKGPSWKAIEAAALTIASAAGSDGEGASGFVVAYEGRKYVATNIHVIEGEARREAQLAWTTGPRVNPHGNRNPRLARARIPYSTHESGRPSFLGLMQDMPLPLIRNRDGTVLKVGTELLVSRTRDIVLLPVETGIEPLELSHQPPVRGEDILIVANPEAAGVMHALKGSVQAVGPDNLEISVQGGKLVGGMSGSPIVSAKSGKVVGLVTYSLLFAEFDPERAVTERLAGRFPEGARSGVRDFGYRIDNATDYEKVSWSRFCREIGVIHALKERTLNVLLATAVPLRMATSQKLVGYEIPPDFNGNVATLYNSHLRNLPMIARSNDPADRQTRWDAYRRQLEQSLMGAMVQISSMLGESDPVRIPYLLKALRDEVERERGLTESYIRLQAGKVPPRGS
jgi:hypothetical protein